MTSHQQPGRNRIPAISRQLPSGFDKSPGQTRLRGIVRTGVERGSIVLLDHDGKLLAQLMGGDPEIIADGRRVTVTGHFVTGLMTTAQQGAPFRVVAAVADPA